MLIRFKPKILKTGDGLRELDVNWRNRLHGSGLHSCDSDAVGYFWEHGNEFSVYIKDGEIFT